MMPNPIVDDLHRIREQLWEQCHGSAEEMAERQRRLQEQLHDRLTDPEDWRRRQPQVHRPTRMHRCRCCPLDACMGHP